MSATKSGLSPRLTTALREAFEESFELGGTEVIVAVREDEQDYETFVNGVPSPWLAVAVVAADVDCIR